MASTHIPESYEAVSYSQKGIEFGDMVFLTNQNLKSSDEYSRFMLFELYKWVQTDFALVVQHDGYVIRPEKWSNSFLGYDYIGAPWPPNTHFTNKNNEVRVGNGGFSLRSKKLLSSFPKLGLQFTDNGTGFFHEDGQICNYHREVLENDGIKFAPVEVAAMFSKEHTVPETVQSFGFHKYL